MLSVKNIPGILILFITIIPIIVISAACKGEAEMPITLTVGDSVKGVYNVQLNDVTIGKLEMSDSRYSVIREGDEHQSLEGNRLNFFLENTQGQFEFEYYSEVTDSTLLDNLADDDIILRVTFLADNNETQEQFFIRNSKEKKKLYFHSTTSELQLWNISKPW